MSLIDDGSSESAPVRAPGRIGRRGPTKGDRRQQAILDAAEALLQEPRAWREVSIDDVAAAAGISRSSFYFYYQSKDLLLAALVERVMAQTAVVTPGGWFSRASDVRPRDALRATFTQIISVWREHGHVLAEAASMWSTVPELRRQWDDLQSQMIRASARQIDLERREGRAPPAAGLDSVALSTVLMWMAERVVSILQAGASSALSYDELVETLTSVWVRTVYLNDDPDP